MGKWTPHSDGTMSCPDMPSASSRRQRPTCGLEVVTSRRMRMRTPIPSCSFTSRSNSNARRPLLSLPSNESKSKKNSKVSVRLRAIEKGMKSKRAASSLLRGTNADRGHDGATMYGVGNFRLPRRSLPPTTVEKAKRIELFSGRRSGTTGEEKKQQTNRGSTCADVVDLTSPAKQAAVTDSSPCSGSDGCYAVEKEVIPTSPDNDRSESKGSKVSMRGVLNVSCHTFFGPMCAADRQAMRELVANCEKEEPFVIVHSVAGTAPAAIVLGKHFGNLVNFRFINDEVVNAIVNLGNQYFFPKDRSTLFMSCLWWTALIGGNGVDGDGGKFHYKRLKRWAKSYKVSELRKMFVPLNWGNEHWTLGYVDFVNRKVLHIDSLRRGDPSVSNSKFSDVILRWIARSAKDELGKGRQEAQFRKANWKCYETGSDFPQQFDGTSCGVFMLATALSLASGKAPSYTHRDIVDIRTRLAQNMRDNALSEL